jgi:hypothetical protein
MATRNARSSRRHHIRSILYFVLSLTSSPPLLRPLPYFVPSLTLVGRIRLYTSVPFFPTTTFYTYETICVPLLQSLARPVPLPQIFDVSLVRGSRPTVQIRLSVRCPSTRAAYYQVPPSKPSVVLVAPTAPHLPNMALNLALSRHDLIRDMTLDQKLKTREMADAVGCSERSIKEIRSNLRYFGSVLP